jgi:transcriptional pleiotropic regulator of transition state genes
MLLMEVNYMKATGIVRRLDQLGRVVLPMELRRTFKIDDNSPLEIFVDSDRIILRKYEPTCIFCGNAEEVVSFNGKNVCKSCVTAMNGKAV